MNKRQELLRRATATTCEELPAGTSGLVSARPGPDLASRGWTEQEFVLSGTAASLGDHEAADFATRAVLRRPVSPEAFSGTLVLEWLNVSSGMDVAPLWTYLADEVVRRGHVWVGVSAQYVGVEGGGAAVAVAGPTPQGLRAGDRYARLHHPGDAYAYDIYAAVADALEAGPLADVPVEVRLAIGESQSASALTTFVNHAHGVLGAFDGYLVHSRAGWGLPLGEPGRGVDLTQLHAADPEPARIREDLDVPVLVVQAEGDLFGRLAYLPARQDDSPLVRLWEIAGSAHADRFQIGEFEEFLGCPRPVNRGQQAYVVRAALRALEGWARGHGAPPSAPRIEVADGAPLRDHVGVTRGGLRTPVVEAPVELLRGDTEPDASLVCQLFGSTLPMPSADIRSLYADRDAYLARYAAATDAAVAAGFLLAEDRAAVMAESRPDLVDLAHAHTPGTGDDAKKS